MLRGLLDDQGEEAREKLVNQRDKNGITPVFLTLQRCLGREGCLGRETCAREKAIAFELD